MLTKLIHKMMKPLAGAEPLCFPHFTLSLQLLYRIGHFQNKKKNYLLKTQNGLRQNHAIIDYIR